MIYTRIEDTLTRALTLIGRVDEVYRKGGPQVRRLSNQFFFEKLLVQLDEDTEIAGAVLREPWATLCAEDFIEQMGRAKKDPGQDRFGPGSKMMTLVPRQDSNLRHTVRKPARHRTAPLPSGLVADTPVELGADDVGARGVPAR
jgi:hypothetical protein